MPISKDLLNALSQGQSFLTHIHTGPDPDSIGSTLAIKIVLERMGKVVTIFGEDETIRASAFLPGVDEILHMPLTEALATFPHDYYLSLDTATPNMISNLKPFPDIHTPIINIDHHPDNTVRSKFSYIDPDASSTAEVLCDLFAEMKVEITADVATCLLFGLLGDTSSFQNSNTNEKTLELGAKLMASGGDYQECMVALTRSFTPEELKVYGYLVNNLEVSDDGLYVSYKMTYDQVEKMGGKMSIGVFSNFFANKVAGTKFSVVMVEKKPDFVVGSMRSRDYNFDVSQIAHMLGGGGHKVASAFRIEKSLPSAEREFKEAVAYLKSKGKI